MSKSIYLLNANTNYEGHKTICAFAAKNDADVLADKCRQLDKIKPSCPHVDASDSVWGKWDNKIKAWKKEHPAGDEYDYYSVEKVELK